MDINSQIYVDKTMLIAETNKLIRTAQRFVCVSRPRRFGKSMAANMLNAYYSKDEDSFNLFSRFLISKDAGFLTYLNKYDVISLNIQDFLSGTTSVDEMISKIQYEILCELKDKFTYIDCASNDLVKALEQILSRDRTQFIFLIDEWDCLLRESSNDSKAQQKYLDFIRKLFKDKAYVALVYMTGILPIKKYGTHSALNMFEEYSMVNSRQFAEFFGFTEKEVEKLAYEYSMNFEEMKEWYDGYLLGDNTHIYNPKSVVSAMMQKSYGNFWTRTETYEALKVYLDLNFDGLRDSIIEMLSGESVPINTERFANDMTSLTSKDDVLTLLVHLGYLSFDRNHSTVCIPNGEIQNEFKLALDGPQWDDVIDLIKNSQKLLEETWNKNEEAAQIIDRIHRDNSSILSYNNENTLACIISLGYYYARNYYKIVREMPAGKGFADLVFIPKKNMDKPALLIELKYDKSAAAAIKQIKEKRYVEALKDYSGSILLIGINYNTRTKEHQCHIEEARL